MSDPLRIIVVEDEMAITLLIEDMLADLGHQVAGIAMRVPQAIELAKVTDADLAILDINLDGKRSFPVAEILRQRGVPFLFASGYGLRGLEPPFEGEYVLPKPFELHDLKAAIDRTATPR